MNTLEKNLEQNLCRQHLVEPQQYVVLAVSGGVDSMVMLHAFSRICKRLKIRIAVVHVNHQLRGKESEEDERFVKEMSFMYSVPYYCECVDVNSFRKKHKLSKQVAARKLRYEALENVRQKIGAHVVATAHHANDNAETVLLNIMRGTGIHGLAGIPAKREPGCIIRPLLFTMRQEIEKYAMQNGVKYRNDSSNALSVYKRNQLRHSILPSIQEKIPHVVETLNMIAYIMRDVSGKLHGIVNETLRTLVRTDSQGCLILDVKKFGLIPEFLQSEIFVEILRRIQIEPTEKKINALCHLCIQPTGRMVELNADCSVSIDREQLVFRTSTVALPRAQDVEIGRSYDYQGCRISINNPEPVPGRLMKANEVEYIDAQRLGRRLVLRSWKTGDWFIPLGMKKKKKLSDFFTDQKIPKYQKVSIPVMESDGAIVWICGKRLDDRFKLTEHSREAIRLTFQSST